MELTKQYLDARIKQIRTQIADKEEMYYSSGANSKATLETLLQELLIIKDLFDEEYETLSKNLATINNNIIYVNKELDRTNELINKL